MLPIAILAGGLATRLRPLTTMLPKALVPICGEPFIAHQLRLLSSQGLEDVVICAGFLGGQIKDFVADGRDFGVRVEYSWDGDAPAGTAGALIRALPLLGSMFLVIYGDSYLPCDYKAVETAFLRSGKQGLMTVFRNEGRWDTSNVEFDDGRILAYDKRCPSDRMHYIDYGLGAFRASAFDGIVHMPVDLARVQQHLVESKELAGLEVLERFYEIGSFEGLNSMAEFIERLPNQRGI